MRPTLAQLEALYWIGRLGSFHAAARKLHLTQPTISARISQLEDILGQKLFERVRQRAELTSGGRNVLVSVSKMLKICDEITDQQGDDSLLRGSLRLGAVESVAIFVLPILLPRLRSRYPALSIELTLDLGSVLNRKLNARELDLAILTDAQGNESVTIEKIGQIQWSWVASTKLLLPDRILEPKDLRAIPILSNPDPSTIFGVMTDWFRSGSVEPNQITICNSLALMSRLVVAGFGVAVLQPQIVRYEIETNQLRVIPTKPAMQSRSMSVAYYDRSHSYQPLIEMIRQSLQESELLTPLSAGRHS